MVGYWAPALSSCQGNMLEKTQVRIVAGSLRGRKLTVVVHEGMRPTPQMVREALFSILGNAVPDRVFYDIFAGTGVVGLEAVSRGATAARLIEKDARQVNDIQKYADQFGVGAKVQVIKADAHRWAERWLPPKDAVNLFLSPPFPDLTEKPEEFLALVNLLLSKAPPESVLTIQTEDGFPVERLPDPAAWDVRRYGRNMLCFLVKGVSAAAAGAAAEPQA
ncbi:MAG: RsmD family RNA methyltransferase [Gemmata sp.]